MPAEQPPPDLAGSTARPDTQHSDWFRLRRSLALLAMTVVAPGSAQLAAGSKRVGRVALRVWLALLGLMLLLGISWMVDRTWLLALGTDTNVLLVLRWLLFVLAGGWVLLLSDAWRLGDPLRMRREHRAATVGVNTALCGLTAGALLFSAHLVAVQRDLILSVFDSGGSSEPYEGRYNILLLGGDSGEHRSGLRPDAISLASVDEDTGRTVLLSLPRNMENVPFAPGSVMAEQFPAGFDCDGCYLNAVYTWALAHEGLWSKDVRDVGVQATSEAVEGITGLPVSYYAMVNMAGFADLVDAVGGVRVDVEEQIPIGGIGSPVQSYIEPGRQRLDGFEALWYARSRVADDDYTRMGRQKCLLNAMLQQLSPSTVVLRVQDIASAGKRLLKTDIPAGELDTFVDLALKARSQPISSVSFVPPKVQTYDPDFHVVRDMVADALDKAEGSYQRPEGDGKTKSARTPGARNTSDDLARAC